MIYYKLLGPNREAVHGGVGVWPPPGEWTVPILHPVVCERGYHLLDRDHLLEFAAPTLWEAEGAGQQAGQDGDDKVAFERARLLRRVETWNDRTLRLFAADCAERVLDRARAAGREPDSRSIAAVAVARRYANGQATKDDLRLARDASWVTWTRDARDATWVATRTAACVAARAAACAAAWEPECDAERRWQSARLWWYLDGEGAHLATQ